MCTDAVFLQALESRRATRVDTPQHVNGDGDTSNLETKNALAGGETKSYLTCDWVNFQIQLSKWQCTLFRAEVRRVGGVRIGLWFHGPWETD